RVRIEVATGRRGLTIRACGGPGRFGPERRRVLVSVGSQPSATGSRGTNGERQQELNDPPGGERSGQVRRNHGELLPVGGVRPGGSRLPVGAAPGGHHGGLWPTATRSDVGRAASSV